MKLGKQTEGCDWISYNLSGKTLQPNYLLLSKGRITLATDTLLNRLVFLSIVVKLSFGIVYSNIPLSLSRVRQTVVYFLPSSHLLSPHSMEIVNPEEYEASHVHRVYEHIAPHFSATRFKVHVFFLFFSIVPQPLITIRVLGN